MMPADVRGGDGLRTFPARGEPPQRAAHAIRAVDTT